MPCSECTHRYSYECRVDGSGYTLHDECGECPGDDPENTLRTFGPEAELHTFEQGDSIDHKPWWAI